MRRFRFEMSRGGDMAGIEFGDPIKPFAAVWLHATGFNAMTYQSILAPLGLRARIASLDLRGHGRSTMPARPGKLKSWHRFRDDVIEWLDKEAPQGVVLGGHSMGGTVALLVAGKRPDLVKGLVLSDPVILSHRIYFWSHWFPPMVRFLNRSGMAAAARKRRAEFGSVQEALESYEKKKVFASWREPFLSDYLLDGLDCENEHVHADEAQTWRLLCEPKWEAACFAAQRNRPWAAMRKVKRKRIPIAVLRPQNGSVITQKIRAQMILLNQNLVMKNVRGTTHFMPMEAPYEVRDQLSSYLARLVEGMAQGEDGLIARSLRERKRRVG